MRYLVVTLFEVRMENWIDVSPDCEHGDEVAVDEAADEAKRQLRGAGAYSVEFVDAWIRDEEWTP